MAGTAPLFSHIFGIWILYLLQTSFVPLYILQQLSSKLSKEQIYTQRLLIGRVIGVRTGAGVGSVFLNVT
jgi:hypothetical protein